MRALRTYDEIEELVSITRTYFSMLMAFRTAKAEGRLSAEQEYIAQSELNRMDDRIERLKNTRSLCKKVHPARIPSVGQNAGRHQHSA